MLKRHVVLLFAWFVVGCSTITTQVDKLVQFIEGEDRIEMKGSTAQVTSLVSEGDNVFAPKLAASVESNAATDSKTTLTKKIDTLPPGNSAPAPAPPIENKRVIEATSFSEKRPVEVESETIPQPKVPAKAPKDLSDFASLDQKSQRVEKNIERKQAVVRSNVSGRINLLGGADAPDDSGQSIVRLFPLESAQKLPPKEQKSALHTIDMKGKTYLPDHLAVDIDDTVVFTNSDKIKHNVFSPSGKNAFDLGTYSAGKKRGVTFKNAGIVKVYCNIHPGMATFVSVGEPGLSAVTDSAGNFRIRSVPVGRYKMSVWNVRGEVSKFIDVTVSGNNRYDLDVQVSAEKTATHQNKFGEKYKKRSALFDDEFY